MAKVYVRWLNAMLQYLSELHMLTRTWRRPHNRICMKSDLWPNILYQCLSQGIHANLAFVKGHDDTVGWSWEKRLLCYSMSTVGQSSSVLRTTLQSKYSTVERTTQCRYDVTSYTEMPHKICEMRTCHAMWAVGPIILLIMFYIYTQPGRQTYSLY